MPECLNSMSSNQAKSCTGHSWPDGSVFDLIRERISGKQGKQNKTQNRQTRKKVSRKKIETSLTRGKIVCGKRGYCQKHKAGRASAEAILGSSEEATGSTVSPLVLLEDVMPGRQVPSLDASSTNLQGPCPQGDTQGQWG